MSEETWHKERMYGPRDEVLWAITAGTLGVDTRVIGSALLEADADQIIALHNASATAEAEWTSTDGAVWTHCTGDPEFLMWDNIEGLRLAAYLNSVGARGHTIGQLEQASATADGLIEQLAAAMRTAGPSYDDVPEDGYVFWWQQKKQLLADATAYFDARTARSSGGK